MNWLRWWRLPSVNDAEQDSSVEAMRASDRTLAAAQRLQPEIDKTAAKLRRQRERNHFAERFQKAIEESRKNE